MDFARCFTFVSLLAATFSCSDPSLEDTLDCTACGRYEGEVLTYETIVRSDTPPELVPWIYDGAVQWAIATSGAVRFSFSVADVEISLDRAVKKGFFLVWTDPTTDRAPNVVGLTYHFRDVSNADRSAAVWIDSTLPTRDFHTVSMHEFGHALGLPHFDDRRSVMYPTVNRVGDKLPCFDRMEICARYGCDPGCDDGHAIGESTIDDERSDCSIARSETL